MGRFRKIYSQGRIYSHELYNRLMVLDTENPSFAGADNEFKENRDWWVLLHKNEIIAYCGSAYSEGICIFIRAWVQKKHRGKGLQKKMIDLRLKAAKGCKAVITYTIPTNYPSANSLISKGFKLYEPSYKWAGKDVLYWRR